MRDFKEKLFPIVALLLAFLVLGGMIRMMYTDHSNLLTGPPDLYVTADGDPFFVQESSSNWSARLGRNRWMGGEGHGHEATRKDMISAASETIFFDFGEHPPQNLTASYSEDRTSERIPLSFENNRLHLQPGICYYWISAVWEGENYSGTAEYSLLIDNGEASPSPPTLELTVDGNTHKFTSGSFQWKRTLSDGKGQSVFADSDHPLRLNYKEPLTVTGKQMAISFSPMPDHYEVLCWPADTAIDDEGNPDIEADMLLPQHDRIDLREGRWIYQIHAEWADTGEGGGKANYSFLINCARP